MKKLFIAFTIIFLLISCTENERVKAFGGDGTINLPKGRKLINITWKESQVWYLTRPMRPDEIAEKYQFQEESSWGMVEGTYAIIEFK
jgi:hypothetical protein